MKGSVRLVKISAIAIAAATLVSVGVQQRKVKPVESRDLGQLPPNSDARASFLVRNTSSQTQTYEGFEAACGARVWMEGNRVLRPGESTHLHMVVRTSRKRGPAGTAFDLIAKAGGMRRIVRYAMTWNVVGSPWLEATDIWIPARRGESVEVRVRDMPETWLIRAVRVPDGVQLTQRGSLVHLAATRDLAPGARLGPLELSVGTTSEQTLVRTQLFVKDAQKRLRIEPEVALLDPHLNSTVKLRLVGDGDLTNVRIESSSTALLARREGDVVLCEVSKRRGREGPEMVTVSAVAKDSTILASSQVYLVNRK